MALELYSHPFSSYCQKVLIALWENGTPFAYRHLEEPAVAEALSGLWPFGRFPVLVDGDRIVAESSIIIEFLDLHHSGPVRLIPDDRRAAIEVRLLDRIFDNDIMTPVQKAVASALRADDPTAPQARGDASRALDTAYGWLDARLGGRTWAAGDDFTMADCAAAPSLFYADWVHPIDDRYATLRDYRTRLLARPSFARAVDEARPYRRLFPLGAPDRD